MKGQTMDKSLGDASSIGLGKLTIRYAKPDDVTSLQVLYHQLVPDENPDVEEMRKTLAYILDHLESVSIIVAENGGDIVGTCQIIVYDNLIRAPQRKAVIDSVVVDAPYRNMGVGTKMVSWAVEELKRRHCKIIYVSFAMSRDIAPKLYRKVGFEPFGTTFYIRYEE